MTGECCGSCRFFLPFVDAAEGDGHCRRYPPSVLHEVEALGVFPEVRGSGWCGEWQASSEELLKDD
jgi:hypothetical protein